MGPVTEAILALLCALGAAVLLTVIPGRGDGDSLEAALRQLAWLRRAGLFRGEAVIWDAGLTPEGRELALHLALRWSWVTCCPRGALEEWLGR